MNKRSVATCIILTFVTFGIYYLVWLVKTKNEMVSQGADVPTAWIWLLPFGLIYWQWKFAGGVEHVTAGKSGQAVSFILIFMLGMIGMAIIQDTLNKTIDHGLPAQLPTAKIA